MARLGRPTAPVRDVPRHTSLLVAAAPGRLNALCSGDRREDGHAKKPLKAPSPPDPGSLRSWARTTCHPLLQRACQGAGPLWQLDGLITSSCPRSSRWCTRTTGCQHAPARAVQGAFSLWSRCTAVSGFTVLLSQIVAVVYPDNWTPNCLSENLTLGHL